MFIDLEPILFGNKDVINIDTNIEIEKSQLTSSDIQELKEVKFIGKVKQIYDLPLTLEGKLNGKMVLLDDICLEKVDYNFDVLVEVELENSDNELEPIIVDNKLDLNKVLWQLILVEVPSKVPTNKKDINLSGLGWRLINEDEVKDNNNAFKDLNKMLEERR